jgi:hypothetical protein
MSLKNGFSKICILHKIKCLRDISFCQFGCKVSIYMQAISAPSWIDVYKCFTMQLKIYCNYLQVVENIK